MKKSDVEIGATYVAKVSGKLTTVRIVNESQHGGWNAINTATKHEVRIRGAARLRRKVEALAYYLDATPNLAGANSSTRQISRSEAIDLVHNTFGIGTWLDNLRRARSAEGLELRGGEILRARLDA